MPQKIRAVYRDGVLVPQEALELIDGQEVFVTVKNTRENLLEILGDKIVQRSEPLPPLDFDDDQLYEVLDAITQQWKPDPIEEAAQERHR
ncbi:MAG: antitoxin family protein [Phototrophicaceae bacterium]|jgi:predicted DNA-binding antitoxin AbrB/MazE fold protein